MARGAWDHTAQITAVVGSLFAKKAIDPAAVNPLRRSDVTRRRMDPRQFVHMLATALGAKKV